MMHEEATPVFVHRHVLYPVYYGMFKDGGPTDPNTWDLLTGGWRGRPSSLVFPSQARALVLLSSLTLCP